mgnify:CR=1 FL=1
MFAVPSTPAGVEEDNAALAYWNKTIRVMGAVSSWVRLDMERQLTDYALLQAQRDRLRAAIRKQGDTYEAEFVHDEGKDNEVLVKSRKAQPEHKLLKETLVEIRNLEVALGLGAVYRTKLDLSGHEDAADDVLGA